MRTAYFVPILLLAVSGTACESVTAPAAEPPEVSALAKSSSAPLQTAAAETFTQATGTFTQTAVTSTEARQAGPNTILEQKSEGLVSGTLSGSYTDDIQVVIHPDGRFNAHFTIRCECTVAGEQGIVHLVASDRGELVSSTLAVFAGRATITGGTADLSDLRGVLEIEGTIDLVTALSEYTYSGRIH